jgi:hypothetical protein
MDFSLYSERLDMLCDITHDTGNDAGDENIHEKTLQLHPNQSQKPEPQHQKPELFDDPGLNMFCCEDCYQCLSYYIDDNLRLNYEQTDLRKHFKRLKKRYLTLRPKYSLLEFELFECKAQKEDLEERFELLMKSLVKTQHKAATTTHIASLTAKRNETLDEVVKEVMNDLMTKVELQTAVAHSSQTVENMEKQWLNGKIASFSSPSVCEICF